jgi:hypothetical protein
MSTTHSKGAPKGQLSSSSPAFFASILGILVGAFMTLFGAYLLQKGGNPLPLSIAVLCVGAIEVAASFYTLQRVRVAWAFALSINATAAVVFLFTSARLRDALELHLLLALVPALTFGLIVLLHALHSEEF